MKEILAIIRPNKMEKTKKILDMLGYSGMTAVSAFGRGKQKALVNEVNFGMETDLDEEDGQMAYVPKRMLSIVVPDEDTNLIVEAVMKVNNTGKIGDGKIFICPISESIRVRTDERGEPAVI
jgi:nitrogen regulatory protein PII 2